MEFARGSWRQGQAGIMTHELHAHSFDGRVSYAVAVKHCHELSGLKQHTLLCHSCCGSEVWEWFSYRQGVGLWLHLRLDSGRIYFQA